MQRANSKPVANFFYGVLGVAVFLALWQWVGKAGFAGPTLPAVSDVVKTLVEPETFASLQRAAQNTVASAAKGLVLGSLLALLLAIVSHLLPPIHAGLDRLAVLVNATPPIAIGPILIVLFSREQTPALLAGIQVFFLMYVAASSGLSSASPGLRRVMSGLGASPLKRLFYLDLPSALPFLATGIKAAVAAAFLGAILGEWFGAPQGLGIVILNAMENFQIPLMWAAVTMAGGLSFIAFLAAAAIEKLVTRRLAR
jgi:ABC-type nitrate/sulfonate/bicarbonate transport system permease component